MVKNLPVMQETWFDPWVGKIPRGRHGELQFTGSHRDTYEKMLRECQKSLRCLQKFQIQHFAIEFYFQLSHCCVFCCALHPFLCYYWVLQLSTCVCAKSLQLCPTLCDPMDCNLPGSTVFGDSPGKNTGVDCHALLQRSSRPRDWTCVSQRCLYWQAGSLPLAPHGMPPAQYRTQ